MGVAVTRGVKVMWTPEMDAELISLRDANTIRNLASWFGLSYTSVQRRSRELDLSFGKEGIKARATPTHEEWVSVATQCALDAKLDPTKLMAGVVGNGYGTARARAWKAMLDRSPQWSKAGLGRVSGFHHTTIMCALRRHAKKQLIPVVVDLSKYRPVARPRAVKYDPRLFVAASSLPPELRAIPRSAEKR